MKLSKEFLAAVPTSPGIYRIYDESSRFIYVGKAKNLRRRLAQYKNAKRRKKHRKMKKIMESAARVDFEMCATDLEAQLLEARLIQTHRPKWNVVGAFYFLYPMIGILERESQVYFCYTTQPETFLDYSFHGAFRSREITRNAFFALVKLLDYVGHRIPRKKKKEIVPPKYSYVYGFRQIPKDWISLWAEFLKGESKIALESLILALVENAGARKVAHEIQEEVDHLVRFWEHEASVLSRARKATQFCAYPVNQKERDLLFLRYRYSLCGR